MDDQIVNADPPEAATASVQNWYQVRSRGPLPAGHHRGPCPFREHSLERSSPEPSGTRPRRPPLARIVMAGAGVCGFAVLHGPDVGWFWPLLRGLGEVVASHRVGRSAPHRCSGRRCSLGLCFCSHSKSRASSAGAPPWDRSLSSTSA